MKVSVLSILICTLIFMGSCTEPFNEKIRYRLELMDMADGETWCDDQSGSSVESCVFLLNGRQYRKILYQTFSEVGELDSTYWYGNPMGVYKMGFEEYVKTFRKEHNYSSSCLSTNLVIIYSEETIIDGCDTVLFSMDSVFSDPNLIVVNDAQTLVVYGLN